MDEGLHPNSAKIWLKFATFASGGNATTDAKAAEWADAMLKQFMTRYMWKSGYGWVQRLPAANHL